MPTTATFEQYFRVLGGYHQTSNGGTKFLLIAEGTAKASIYLFLREMSKRHPLTEIGLFWIAPVGVGEKLGTTDAYVSGCLKTEANFGGGDLTNSDYDPAPQNNFFANFAGQNQHGKNLPCWGVIGLTGGTYVLTLGGMFAQIARSITIVTGAVN
jgi:hypothetical protein